MSADKTTWEVTWLSVCDHYDIHRDGWLRCGPRNRYHFFTLTKEDVSWDVEWSVYEAPGTIAIPHLRRVGAFRRMVWWGFSYDPRAGSRHDRRPGRQGQLADRASAPFKAFYAMPRLAKVDLDACRLIGTTQDLRSIRLIEERAIA